jgi:hypothetical protein
MFSSLRKERGLELNRATPEARFEKARRAGAAYLVECRDVYDAVFVHDCADRGVYYEELGDAAAVDALAVILGNNAWNCILAIYDLSRPLAEQGPGLARDDWLSLRP